MKGFVSLVGAGPGDPGLMTVAGRDRLAAAEVVVYDRLANPELLKHAPATAELIFAGKSPQRHALSQTEINELLVKEGLAGKRVVRLKGGDPFVFGRGGEEALALVEAGVSFEVIPGVTSAIAAPAYAGVPVTHRGVASSFAVVTGHEDDEKEDSSVDWSRIANAVDTIVVLMGGAALPSVTTALIKAGRSPETPALSVQWGTTTQQRVAAATLSTIAETVKREKLGTPLLTVIGEVAALRGQIGWFEQRPLFGKRVLVTRTRHQASALSELLRREGAIPVELPTLELAPIATADELSAMTARLLNGDYAWCLFSSTNAIESVFEHLDSQQLDARVFAGCKVAALGSATAALLRSRGLRPDLVASEFSSEGLVDALASFDLAGQRVLIPRAEGGSPALLDGLRARGAEVDEIALYESRPPREADPGALALIREGKIDVVTFASSSSVKNLSTLLGNEFKQLRGVLVASIGPVTSDAVRECGLEVTVEPAEHTIPALVEALVEHFKPE